MQIQKACATPAFTAKFVNNKAFQEVLNYAKENNCLRTLDNALNNLATANRCSITIMHGKSPNGQIYSCCTAGKRSIPNCITYAKTPQEASFEGIVELSMLGKKFRSLVGDKVKHFITTDDIVKKYTV